jgi:putative endonuclease
MIGRLFDTIRHNGRKRTWEAGKASGRRSEDLAHRFLRKQGYKIVARNYRMPGGEAELDLIGWEGDTLAIVEVKSRASTDFGPPERAVDSEKLRRLQRAARLYARRAEVPMERVRFDLVTVVLSDPPEITLFRGLRVD